MSEYDQYYESFRQGRWATLKPNECLCHGSGWALSDLDTWHKCPQHYKGQTHPEDFDYNEAPKND
jgi:hypothetical protein